MTDYKHLSKHQPVECRECPHCGIDIAPDRFGPLVQLANGTYDQGCPVCAEPLNAGAFMRELRIICRWLIIPALVLAFAAMWTRMHEEPAPKAYDPCADMQVIDAKPGVVICTQDRVGLADRIKPRNWQ